MSLGLSAAHLHVNDMAFLGRDQPVPASPSPRRKKRNRGVHCRNPIRWLADRARTPNIRWLIILMAPLRMTRLPPTRP